MNIALAHDWLTSYAGSEQLLFHIHQIFPGAPIYTTIYQPKKIDQSKFNPKLIHTSWLQKIPGAKSHHQIIVPLMPWAIHWDFSDYDIVISDSSWVMKGISRDTLQRVSTSRQPKHIAIILTPTRWLWGFGGDNRADNILAKPLKNILRKWDLRAAQKPDVLVAISKTVQQRIKDIYHRDSVVIYPPVETDRFKIVPENEIQDYFLSVGRLVPYKKVDIIIEAFNKLKLPLKIIGEGREKQKLQKIANNNIEFLGSITNEKRNWYYSRARGFIFPVDEDFGIVPVEAMASGCPVIAYKKGGATETITEGLSGIFFNKQTPESLIEAMQKFQDQAFDANKIVQSVQKFSVENFQNSINALVNTVLESN